MGKSNVFDYNMSDQSTDDELEIPLYNNSINVAANELRAQRVVNYLRNLDSGGNKQQSLQVMENKRSNQFVSEDQFHTAIETVHLTVAGETTNMSKTILSCEINKSEEDQVLIEDPTATKVNENQVEQRRKSVIFASKRKPVLEGRQNKELNDSGVIADDLNETSPASVIFSSKKNSKLQGTQEDQLDDIGVVRDISNENVSATKCDIVIADKRSNTSGSDLSQTNSTSDEEQVSLDDRSPKNQATAVDDDQGKKVAHPEKVNALKRKLFSQGLEVEHGQKPNKRGRGKYRLRDIPTASYPSNIDKKKLVNHRPKKLKEGNTTRQVSEESETLEDSSAEVETIRDKPRIEDKSSQDRRAYHNEILKILNEGSPESIKSLNRIGTKTAVMIYRYRKFNGKFQSLRDLEKISGWSQKLLETFLASNNITFD